jgi:hypothetical protein
VPIDGGALVPIAGLQPDDYPIGWTGDGRVYVADHQRANLSHTTIHVDKLDPHTGARASRRDLPLTPIGGSHAFSLRITPDGSSYTYGYNLYLSDLYTISNAR